MGHKNPRLRGGKPGAIGDAVVMSAAAKPNWRRLYIAGAVLVALAAGGTLLYMSLAGQPTGPQTAKPLTAEQTIDEARNLKNQRDYGKAASLTEQQYDKEQDAGKKYLLALQTASIYETQKDYPKAIEWYKVADGYQANQHAAMAGLGRSHMALNQKPQAAEYFKKAIAAIDRDVIGADTDVEYYESLLAEAEGRVVQ